VQEFGQFPDFNVLGHENGSILVIGLKEIHVDKRWLPWRRVCG
jgi:hypothetical protein